MSPTTSSARVAAPTAGAMLAGGRPLANALYGDLIWIRPGWFGRELRLEAGSEVLARLSWPKRFSSEAIAESADGRWIIRHHRGRSWLGVWTLTDPTRGNAAATFTRHWRRRGELRLASGAAYTWERAGFWSQTFFWSPDRETRLVSYRQRASLGERYEMEVDPAARAIRELPILVLLGAYLMTVATSHRHG